MPPDLSDVFVNHNIPRNRFEVDLDDDHQAVLIYMIKAGLFVMLHTEVPPQFEGRGIAGKMAKEALQFAAREGLKVRSYCTFTTRYIERHPEYHYLLG